MLLDDTAYPDAALRDAVFTRIARDQLMTAATIVRQLVRPTGDTTYYERLATRHGFIRQFLPALLRTITFSGIAAAQPILDALDFLRSLEGKRTPSLATAPRAVITSAWQRLVITPDDAIDRCFYTFCVLERLQDALHRRDIYVHPGERWGNPRAKLIADAAWSTMRPQVCRTLGRDTDGERELTALATLLDAAYQQTIGNLPTNPAVTIVAAAGDRSITLTPLDKLDEPTSLTALQHTITTMLPHIDLPDAILDIHADTLIQANARLVEAQTRITLAQAWGGGEGASADGLRFVVPVRTLNAGPNSTYFHVERGVTYDNFASNQFTGFHGIVIPGTVHEGPYLLEGL